MQDWNYEWTNDFEITLELGCDKYPSKDNLEPLWGDNKEALMTFMEHVHMGVKGEELRRESENFVWLLPLKLYCRRCD